VVAGVIPQRRLGDRSVSAIGLGGAPIALRPVIPDEAGAVRMVHAALDAGVTLLDTADVYSPNLGRGYSESIFGRAVRTWPGGDDVVIATKGGKYWDTDGEVRISGRPDYLKRACEASLEVLGLEVIDLYQLHEPDPDVPYEESIGALIELRREGKIKQIGISNVDVALIRRTLELTPLASVQNRFGPDFRHAGAEIDLCQELGIAFMAWGPLGGLQASKRNESVRAAFASVGAGHGVSPEQVAIAWQLTLSACLIPIPGATRPETILDSVRGAQLDLSLADLAILGAASSRPAGQTSTYEVDQRPAPSAPETKGKP
jgi:aryl-alcohol dehydrogenase-like predicted oxidoreductase